MKIQNLVCVLCTLLVLGCRPAPVVTTEVTVADSTVPFGTMQVHVLKVLSGQCKDVNLQDGQRARSFHATGGNDGKVYSIVLLAPTAEPLKKGDEILVAYVGFRSVDGTHMERLQFVRAASKLSSKFNPPWQALVDKNGSAVAEWPQGIQQ